MATANNSNLAYDAIIAKLKMKLQRQTNTVIETQQHINAIEALKVQQTATKS